MKETDKKKKLPTDTITEKGYITKKMENKYKEIMARRKAQKKGQENK